MCLLFLFQEIHYHGSFLNRFNELIIRFWLLISFNEKMVGIITWFLGFMFAIVCSFSFHSSPFQVIIRSCKRAHSITMDEMEWREEWLNFRVSSSSMVLLLFFLFDLPTSQRSGGPHVRLQSVFTVLESHLLVGILFDSSQAEATSSSSIRSSQSWNHVVISRGYLSLVYLVFNDNDWLFFKRKVFTRKKMEKNI